MPEAAPVDEDAPDILTLLKRITARHPRDVAVGRLPDFPVHADHYATLDWLAREASTPERDLPRDDLTDGLLLIRYLRNRVDWFEFVLIEAAKRKRRPRMTAKRIGDPLGITSRQGLTRHTAALATRLEAARKHVTATRIRHPENYQEHAPTRPSQLTPRSLAAALLAHWEDLGASEKTLEEIGEWAEGIELILGEDPDETRAESEAGSLRAQMRLIVKGLDADGCQPATPEASRVLDDVRTFPNSAREREARR